MVRVTRQAHSLTQARDLLAELNPGRITARDGTSLAMALKDSSAHLSNRLARDFTREVTKAIEAVDTDEWSNYLRSGLTVADGGSVLRVRFHLGAGPEAAPATDDQPGAHGIGHQVRRHLLLAGSNLRRQPRRHRLGLFDQRSQRTGDGAASTATISATTSRHGGHAVSDELQLGNRATNSARIGVDHALRVEVRMFSREGTTAAVDRVIADKAITIKSIRVRTATPIRTGIGRYPSATHPRSNGLITLWARWTPDRWKTRSSPPCSPRGPSRRRTPPP